MACARTWWLLCLLLCATAAAQETPPEVSRYRAGPDGIALVDCSPCSGAPAELVVAGKSLYFSADDGIHGRELWRLNANGKLHLAFELGGTFQGGELGKLTAFKDGVVFAGTSTDGMGGPRKIFFLAPGAIAPSIVMQSTAAQNPERFTVSGNWVYFEARTPETGLELWVSDGTPGNTRIVWDAVPGPGDGVRRSAAGALPGGGAVVASLAKVPGLNELSASVWTVLPPDFTPVSQMVDGFASFLHMHYAVTAVLQDAAVIAGGEWSGNRSFLRTNGRPEGSAFLYISEEPLQFASELLAVGNTLYMGAQTKQHGMELWHSDGTPGSARLLKDIWPGASGAGPHKLTQVGDRLFFAANDGEHGSELWVSDGTPEGTQMVADLLPGPADGAPYSLIAYKGLCYFSIENETYGEELWRSDGTPEGTRMVIDLHPGKGDAEPYYLCVFNDRLYFAANDGVHGEELWSTDGTAEGTRMEADIMRPERREPSANPEQLTAYEGALYCVAEDGAHGRELWRATPKGMAMVLDLAPGAASAEIVHLCVEAGRLHFDAKDADGRQAHYESDGTAAGTRATGPALGRRAGKTLEDVLPETVRTALVTVPLARDQWCARDGLVAFSGYSDAAGREPWAWREGMNAPLLLRDHMKGPAGSFPREFTATDEGIYYTAEIQAGMTVVFRVNPETLAVERVGTGLFAVSSPRAMTPIPGGVAFVANGGHWPFIGVATGDQWTGPFFPSMMAGEWAPTELCLVGNAMYSDFNDPIYGRELWVKVMNETQPRLVADLFRGKY